jgi:hypothetical protein
MEEMFRRAASRISRSVMGEEAVEVAEVEAERRRSTVDIQ